MKNRQEEKLRFVKDKILMGIDVGKNKSWATLRFPNDTFSKPRPFSATAQGFQELLGWLNQTLNGDLSKLLIGMEPTSVYYKPIAYFFKANRFSLVLVSCLQTSIARKLSDNSPLKSDKKDTFLILGLMAQGNYMDCYLPEGAFAELRQLSSQKERLWHDIQRHVNYAVLLMDQLFPEYKSVFEKPMSPSSRAILQYACTPQMIRAAGVKQLTSWIMEVWRNKKGAAKKAQQLYQCAQRSCGVQEGVDSLILSLKMQLEIVNLLEEKNNLLEEKLVKESQKVEYAKYLRSIPDLGEVTCARLIGELGDIKRFRAASQVYKMAGLNLYQVTSGKTEKDESRIRRKITKCGRPRIRRLLHFMALRGIQEKSIYHPYFDKVKRKKKRFEVTAVAFARKILGLIYSLVKNEVEFDREKWKREHRSK